MNKEIVKYPSPVLRKKCEGVKDITPEIKELGWDMVESMQEKEGVGLAAPQVGETKRVIVVQAEKPLVFFNPKIIKKTRKTEVAEEGCLSFPGLWLKVKRAKGVVVEALNQNGEKIKIEVEGFPARIFQHEIDHLDGILFIDRISFWQRLKIRKQLKKFKN
jgi:peptide deformylase